MKIKNLISYNRSLTLQKLLFFAQKGKLVKNLAISRPWASVEVPHYGTVEWHSLEFLYLSIIE